MCGSYGVERDGFDFVRNHTTIRQYSSIVRKSGVDCKLVSIMAKQNTAMNTPQLMVSWIWGGSWLMIAGIWADKRWAS